MEGCSRKMELEPEALGGKAGVHREFLDATMSRKRDHTERSGMPLCLTKQPNRNPTYS